MCVCVCLIRHALFVDVQGCFVDGHKSHFISSHPHTHTHTHTHTTNTPASEKNNVFFNSREVYPQLRCNASYVRALLPLLKSQGVGGVQNKIQLIDARGKVQFDGSEVRAARGGRIPHSVNVPYKVLINDTAGGYLPLAEMRERLHRRNVSVPSLTTGDTVLYCNGGVASTAVLFALFLLGAPLCTMANYDGSWGEWGNQSDDNGFPVEL
mmetsp:Transcript_33102/g.53348  ORF Transcript_33102/g.53348 Transcript_33102/m.53348 type:complete len:210 (+) Transcript_33102:44-673(+)